MTATNVRVQMQQRRDTAANWTAAGPTLLAGEIGYETDTGKIKIGDGATAWASLAYLPIPDSTGELDDDLTITGNLTVQGTTTTIESTTLTVEDKNIELAVVDTPSDTTADGGGITLKGATDKTINWVDATDAWTFSEHIDIASAKEFRIDGTKVLDATSLGSAVVSSSLTSVGTIGAGTWEGDAIDAAYLDATVVTTSDTGTVTSTMIADGTIVNDDINASAAIAGTKIDPDFGSQTVTIGGLNANLVTREQFEETEIKRNAAFSVGTAGAIPFGVGPVIPPGMAFFGIGADAYNTVHVTSGSFC